MDKFDILDTFDFLDTSESVENFDLVDMKSTSVSNESLSLFEYSNELRKELKRVDAVESTRVPSYDELVGERFIKQSDVDDQIDVCQQK